ncbi:MAG: hypothetical protein DWH78_01365, partial [Planctomycetota bacterium]
CTVESSRRANWAATVCKLKFWICSVVATGKHESSRHILFEQGGRSRPLQTFYGLEFRNDPRQRIWPQAGHASTVAFPSFFITTTLERTP